MNRCAVCKCYSVTVLCAYCRTHPNDLRTNHRAFDSDEAWADAEEDRMDAERLGDFAEGGDV